MRYKQPLTALLLASLTVVANAATVVTFDDLIDYSYIPDGYGGAETWNSTYLNHSPSYAVSGEFIAHGPAIDVSFGSPIFFSGTYYNSWGGARGGNSYELYFKGNLVFSAVEMDNHSDQLYWLDSGYSGAVDRVVFYGSSDGAVIDNFTYSAAPVPEPETYGMLLAGLGLVGAMARRRASSRHV